MPRTTRVGIPILVFLLTTAAAALGLTWLQAGLGWSTFVVRLPLLAPGVGALAVAAVFGRRLVWPPVTPTRWKQRLLLAVEMAAAIWFLVWFFVFVARQFFPKINAIELPVPFVVLIVIQLVVWAAHEAGWRGTFQPLLETRIKPFWAALLTGLAWGLGQLVYATVTPAHYLVQLVGTIGFSLVLAAATLQLRRRDRIVLATLVQWLVSVAFLVWFGGGNISIGWLTYTTIAFAASGAACAPLLLGRPHREHERVTAHD